MPKPANTKERAYMARVAALGCYLCRYLGRGESLAHVHHVGNDGMGLRGSHFLTVPVCPRHHDNSSIDGIHGQRRAWKLAGVTELDALADTIERLQA